MRENEIKKILNRCFETPTDILDDINSRKINLEKKYKNMIKSKCYLILNEFDKCEDYAFAAIEEMKEEGMFIPSLYADIGLCEYKKNKFIDAKNYFYSALEYAEIDENEEATIEVILSLIKLFIVERIYEQAFFLTTRLNFNYLYSMKNTRVYMDVIAHLSILNYILHNVNDGDKYKEKFSKRYDNYINNDNRCFLNNLKYRILKYRNESIGNYEEAIKYIDIIDTEGYLKNDKVLYYEMMKDKALIYKKIGNEDKAVDLLLNICRDAAKLELFRTALDVLEEIVAWGYEDTIPRQLCISLILIAIKTNKQDIRKEIIIDLRSLKEIIEIKKEAKEQIKNNKSLKDTLEEFQLKSNLDPLTNAYNRRYLNQVLDSNKCLIKKYTTLAMIDVDDFKGINDKFGHLIGDRSLIEISTMIKFVIGINGKIFRYGGDEFFILYNHSRPKEGENILRKIFCKSKKLRINHIIKGHEITLSIGGITILEDERIRTQMNKVVKICDKILYDIKEDGKNHYRLYYKI